MLALLRRFASNACLIGYALGMWLRQSMPFPLEGGRTVSPHTGSVETAIRGIHVLHNTHLHITPQFLDVEDAVFDAFQTSRLLLVFLHSELSNESRQTLQHMLQCSQLTTRLQRDFSFFAISVLDERTHLLPTVVSGADLPCVAVFAPVGGEHGLSHVATMEGKFSIGELESFLNDCLRLHGIR